MLDLPEAQKHAYFKGTSELRREEKDEWDDLEQPCARLTAPNKSEVTLANRKIRWLSELRPNEAVFRLQELAQSR